MRSYEIFVPGAPATKGSFRIYRTKGGRNNVVPDNKRSGSWERAVAWAAQAAGWHIWPGPVHVYLTFRLPRPKSHYGTGRNAGTIRPAAPDTPTSKPDIDKMIRAVLDGLSGVAYEDDAQVVRVVADKTWADPTPGVHIRIAQR